MTLTALLQHIIQHDSLHAKLLNTLSLLENIGARKISASENAHTTTLMVLKHAAEEHRHAYYLKKQITRLGIRENPTYHPDYLIAPIASKHYLQLLDLKTSRYLRDRLHLHGAELKFAAYLLVTYAIEVRADQLYPVYQAALQQAGSKVSVRSIIVEEQGHLEEMIIQLKEFSVDWESHAAYICAIEEQLHTGWTNALIKDSIA
ncbi:hypothetical protein [Pedobacter antarcticus]|uniref:hypothetical protein n=1 Tax=Pedobacter antarcticus TaxID=34086 RepID=UPI0008853C62|nr:hypothetical protein [Pedobacter antarcticus]SDL80142.1 hypothetical protein SAMN04488084_102502 [Pedobacter antarcticus]